MKHSMLILTLLVPLGLSACDRPSPTVVNVPAPAPTVAVPGPAGPAGATGAPGTEGSKGESGKPGEGTTVIVTPPAPVPAK